MVPAFQVNSPDVAYTATEIRSQYKYQRTLVSTNDQGQMIVTPQVTEMEVITETTVPKLGVMFVGMGGNNGSTVVAGVLANKHSVTWHTKEGEHTPDYRGSVMQSSTTQLGYDAEGKPVFLPLRDMLATVDPNELVFGGWDISKLNMAESMQRAQVLEYDLQRQLVPHMEGIVPLPSVYYPDFIAANQEDRADNVLPGTAACTEHVETIRQNIRDFKAANSLDKVIVLWTANTERFCEITEGVHDTEETMLKAVAEGHPEVAPSHVFAIASILEGCSYINGSPQNTFVPGIVQMARARGVFIGGDDFKSGQTKIKSALVDFLVSAGIKPESIVSYNHLGNNDGKNLSAPAQFRSKEISKSNVVDDMVASNKILYKEGEHPDHCVVIKYVPYVGDSKRAMDEYMSSIFLGGKNTIVMHNTCEDSLLAAPLIIDLILLTELMERIQFHVAGTEKPQKMDAVLSILSFLLKAPMVPEGTPVINAFFRQRACIENVLRACVGLPAINDMLLEAKLRIPDSAKN